MSVEEIMSVVRENDFNVTFSGGDPLLQVDALVPLAEAIRAEGYTIWCYTGYLYEAVKADGRLSRILPFLDALVDGPFVEALRDTSLRFRGSSNQRIIELNCPEQHHE